MKEEMQGQELGGASQDEQELEIEKVGDTIKCLNCGEAMTKILRNTYATEVLKDGQFVDDTNLGYSEIFCGHCETELGTEELEALGLI